MNTGTNKLNTEASVWFTNYTTNMTLVFENLPFIPILIFEFAALKTQKKMQGEN